MKHVTPINEFYYPHLPEDEDEDVEYPDIMEYLDNTLVIDSDGYTKSKSEDPEIIKLVNLGGIYQVARSKYPQLTEEELNRTSTLWFWHNLPVDMVKKMQIKDPGRFKFMTKFFGAHPSLSDE